jgi:hypothetical protein
MHDMHPFQVLKYCTEAFNLANVGRLYSVLRCRYRLCSSANGIHVARIGEHKTLSKALAVSCLFSKRESHFGPFGGVGGVEAKSCFTWTTYMAIIRFDVSRQAPLNCAGICTLVAVLVPYEACVAMGRLAEGTRKAVEGWGLKLLCKQKRWQSDSLTVIETPQVKHRL